MFILAYCTRSTSGNCCRHIICCPIGVCHFICMTCDFYCMKIDFVFFFILCISFLKFILSFPIILSWLCRFFNCKSTNSADITITSIPNLVLAFSCIRIVLLIKMNIMMIASCTFIHNTCSCFNSTTLRTTIFCISITSTGRFNSYTCISMFFCTRICHINLIYKYSTPHKLVIIVYFFAVTHFFHLRLFNVKVRSICAVIRVIIALFKCISEMFRIIYSTLTGNKSEVSRHRYIHLRYKLPTFIFNIFDCHCCNRMIFECEICFTLIANRECHSAERDCVIPLTGYGVIYFNSFNLTRAEIVA